MKYFAETQERKPKKKNNEELYESNMVRALWMQIRGEDFPMNMHNFHSFFLFLHSNFP